MIHLLIAVLVLTCIAGVVLFLDTINEMTGTYGYSLSWTHFSIWLNNKNGDDSFKHVVDLRLFGKYLGYFDIRNRGVEYVFETQYGKTIVWEGIHYYSWSRLRRWRKENTTLVYVIKRKNNDVGVYTRPRSDGGPLDAINALIKEQEQARLVRTTYESTDQSDIPSCVNGCIKGSYMLGITCSQCNTEVKCR